jgi:xanthine/uracil permease
MNKNLARKIGGIILIIIGLVALFTPLTPGSWLAIIGLELIGVRLAFVEKKKLRFWKNKSAISIPPEEELKS